MEGTRRLRAKRRGAADGLAAAPGAGARHLWEAARGRARVTADRDTTGERQDLPPPLTAKALHARPCGARRMRAPLWPALNLRGRIGPAPKRAGGAVRGRTHHILPTASPKHTPDRALSIGWWLAGCRRAGDGWGAARVACLAILGRGAVTLVAGQEGGGGQGRQRMGRRDGSWGKGGGRIGE